MNWKPERERDGDELDWQAFRYIADELNPRQRREFEDRLADDQEARDAVVRAVELGELTYQCLEASSVSPGSQAAKRDSGRAIGYRSLPSQTPAVSGGQAKYRAPAILLAAAIGLALLASTWSVIWQRASQPDSFAGMNLDLVDAWSSLGGWEPGEAWALPAADPGFPVLEPWVSRGVRRDDDTETTGPSPESGQFEGTGSASDNWMLVALIDLQREEVGDSGDSQ